MAKPKKPKGRATPKIDRAWFLDQFEGIGLSQRGAARELGMDPSSLVTVLAGERRLLIQEALNFARVLKSPLREILERCGYDLDGIGL